MFFASVSLFYLIQYSDFVKFRLSPLSSSPRHPILRPSLFNIPEKTFQLPKYAKALAQHLVTSNTSPISNEQVLRDPRVLQYLDITAVEENVHNRDYDLSLGTLHQASAASDSSSTSSAVDSSSSNCSFDMSVSSSPSNTP
jgi:hypothetical protein